MSRKLFLMLIVVSALGMLTLAIPASAQDATEPIPLIIDTDMGADDWMALLYLLKSPAVSVEAITISGTGVATCDAGTEIALGILSLMDVVNVPVSCGSETPLQGEDTFPTEWRVTSSTAANLGLPDGDEPADADAVTLLTSVIESSSDNVTILTLGPLTNLGTALQATPELVEKIDMVYIIGGALQVPGSGISRNNTTAEWNFYLDPLAAELVFDSGASITLIPLDATNRVPVTEDFVENFDLSRATAEADFVYNVLAGNEEGIQGGWYFFWDPFAAAVVTDPSLVSVQREPVMVIREGRHTGRTVVNTSGAEMFIALNPDEEAFEQLFADTLNR